MHEVLIIYILRHSRYLNQITHTRLFKSISTGRFVMSWKNIITFQDLLCFWEPSFGT